MIVTNDLTWLGKQILLIVAAGSSPSVRAKDSLFSPFRIRMGDSTGGLPSKPKYTQTEL